MPNDVATVVYSAANADTENWIDLRNTVKKLFSIIKRLSNC